MPPEECLCHWHEHHRCGGDPKICHFVTKGLFYATVLYGNPRSSVNEVRVVLRLDRSPETVEVDTGVFTIYISKDPQAGSEDNYWFHALLAHEVAHLLNAHLFDCYVEGLNGIFAEELLTRTSVGAEQYRQHLEGQRCVDTSDAFYAATYFMMKDVLGVAGEECMSTFLECAKPTEGSQGRMHIDINQWLKSFPDEGKRKSVKEKILEHVPSVESARQQNRQAYMFCLPTDDS